MEVLLGRSAAGKIMELLSKPVTQTSAKFIIIAAIVFLINRRLRRQMSKTKQGNKGKGKLSNLASVIDLLRLCVPSWRSKQAFLLALHSLFLVARTFASIHIATMDGKIVRCIIDRNLRGFLRQLMMWVLFAIPASYINSMLHFLESKLAISLRTRLVQHAYTIYLNNDTYYKVGNLDTRLPNPDQCMTEDIDKFCQAACQIYSHISKPLLDVVLMTSQLIKMGRERTDKGVLPVFGLAVGVIGATASILKIATPPFGKLVAKREEKGGELRNIHHRIITHAEEIAFFGGNLLELRTLQTTYQELIRNINNLLYARLKFVALEQFLLKYFWAATGMVLLAWPAISDKRKHLQQTASERAGTFITARKLLVDGADAVERIISAGKELAELGGYAERVKQMFTVFEQCSKGQYVRNTEKGNVTPVQGGQIILADRIACEDVSVVTPSGDLLAKHLTFEVKQGMHLLICGPNGCGKTSLFRMLGDLWPVSAGTVYHPKRSDMFYVPQRPYLTTGTLREQLIYPNSRNEMAERGVTDEDLIAILKNVRLEHVLSREGGWEIRKDWRDVLSGGEKQRLGLGRVMYHKPHFAILDECTSQVSIDVEGQMYTGLKQMGISLLTVSHRPSLWQFHTHLLQFDGHGGWSFGALNAETRLELRHEKTQLEAELASLPEKKERLRQLCELLGEESSFANA